MATASEAIDENYDDEDDGGLSGFWILIIFMVVLVAFAGIIYIAYQKGMHAMAGSDADLPVIAADPTPVREEVVLDPVDPGRQEVFDELNDVSPTRIVADVNPSADPLEDFTESPSASSTTASDPAPVQTAAVEPANIQASQTTQPVTVPAPQQQTPAATQTQPTPAASQPASTPSTTASAGGTHVVQVGAFGSNDEAMTFYGQLIQKHGSLVANQTPDVQVADVNGRTYHRLRLAGFNNRSAAQSHCQRLSAAGTDCFVKAR